MACRNLSPGSQWLFVKIYAGPSEVDRLLSAVVAPLVSDAFSAGLADRWFFLRYSDPEYHLRLRFRGEPRVLHGDLLVRLHQALEPWLHAGTVNRVQLDTYQPEIERYGGPLGLDLAERIFHADSDAVLGVLALLEGDAGAESRWQLALRSLEAMLDDFGLAWAEKRAFVARRRREYGAEFGADQAGMKMWLSDRFRHYRRTLDALWDRRRDSTSAVAPGLEIWSSRSQRLRPIAHALRDAHEQGTLAAPLLDVIDSHVHMHVNRLARVAGRAHELVMFDFLDRHFASVEARARKQQEVLERV
jgi:thiopeptide-type bacteriocin biosynthesis protein